MELRDRDAAAEQRIQALEDDRASAMTDSVPTEEIAPVSVKEPQTLHTKALKIFFEVPDGLV